MSSLGIRRLLTRLPGVSGPVVDPDVDLHDPAQRGEIAEHRADVLAVISVGGVLGAEARFGVGHLLAYDGTGVPWSTLLVNVSGCLAIGVLMGLLNSRPGAHRLVRPFVGVGMIGGYTTFSTFAVDVQQHIVTRQWGSALTSMALTLVLCVGAVAVALELTAMATARSRIARESR